MQSVAQTIQGMLVAAPRVYSFRGASKLLSMTDRIANPHASPVAIRVMAQGHRLKLDRRCQAEKWAYYTGRYDCEDLELLCRLLRPLYATSAEMSGFRLCRLLTACSTLVVIFTPSSR